MMKGEKKIEKKHEIRAKCNKINKFHCAISPLFIYTKDDAFIALKMSSVLNMKGTRDMKMSMFKSTPELSLS